MKYKAAIDARKGKIEELKGSGATEVLNQADKQAQRAIQEAQRVAQEARYKAQEAHEGRMYDQAKRSADAAIAARPTAEERKVSLALTRVGGDRVIQALAQAAKEPGLPQDEYDSILRKIEARERAIFKNQGVKEIPVGVESTVQTATNAKGEVITSTDGGTTWKDAKGKIVK
jgi:Zn-dependent alcohol dehydrogenase